jgi:NADH-quinone oxidoreductase subunit G
MSVKITIDGREYEVDEKLSLLEACKSLGIKVPYFCYHPGLGPDGNCRMCQVEIKTPRGSQLVISCKTAVTQGMIVETNTERVKAVRAGVMEFLLLNHPLDCPICDKAGECKLQNYYMTHDLEDSFQEFGKLKKRKAVALGETLVLDQERCILCNRCVRFLHDITGNEELYIAGRGSKSYLTAFPGKQVESPYSLNTVELCPVGALTSRDFRFSSPAWFLKKSPSVCTKCSRNCSIEIDHNAGRIFRLRPRRNLEVNGYWMCDEGRLHYKVVNENRVSACEMVVDGRRVEVTYEEALRAVLKLLGAGGGGGAGKGSFKPKEGTVLLASAASTLEEFFLLKRFSRVCLQGAEVFAVRHVPDGVEDDLLRKSDRHANAAGAKLLSIPMLDLRDEAPEADAGALKKLIKDGGIIFALGFDYEVSSRLNEVFESSAGVAVLSACRERLTSSSQVVIPAMTFAEKEGIIVNFQDHAQALYPANVGNNYIPEGFDLSAKGVSQWRAISDLIELVRAGEGFDRVMDIREAIVKEEAAFSGIDLNALGETGKTVSGAVDLPRAD